jgi:putative ABC transport system permease protein
MESLFGLPMSTLMLILLLLFGAVLLVVAVIAIRNSVVFKMGVRNIPRRPAQSMLIVAGLTLSTIIITAALGTGDTLTHSIRAQAIERLGYIDQQVLGPPLGPQGAAIMTQAEYDTLRDQISTLADVDGVAPLFTRTLAVTAPDSGQGEPASGLLATNADFEASFGGWTTADGTAGTLAALAEDEVYLNRRGATALNVEADDQINLYFGEKPTTLRVRAIIENDGLYFASGPVIVMPLERARALAAAPDEVSALLITNTGGIYEGARLSDEVTRRVRLLVTRPEVAERIREILVTPAATDALSTRRAELEATRPLPARQLEQITALQQELEAPAMTENLRSLLADNEVAGQLVSLELAAEDRAALSNDLVALSTYRVEDVKARALATAEEAGNVFFSIFLVFGTFSVLAGLLLIFLIFVMLAAERKSEMGMARAVGLHRRHLIQSFLTEGTIYDVLAAAIGTGLGVLVSWIMVRVLAGIFNSFTGSDFGLTLRFQMTPYSIVIAFCLGMLLTFLTVTFSSWRVSRLNIVAAIRDLPEDEHESGRVARLLRLVRALLLIVVGGATMSGGYSTEQAALVFSGLSLMIIGAGLLLAWILHRTPINRRVSDRLAFTLIGGALVALWMAPSFWQELFDIRSFEIGNSFFILAGIFAVMGGVWLIIYNGDLLLRALSLVFGRFGNLAPVLKTATAYPLVSKFRTGMTIAMFGLIIFVLVILTTVVTANDAVFGNREGITGGYDIAATINGQNRIGDLGAAIEAQPELNAADYEVISPAAQLPLEVRQIGASNQAWTGYFGASVAPSYFDNVEGSFTLKHVAGYPDDASVWRALRERDDVVLLQRNNVRSQQAAGGGPPVGFEVEGAYIEDEILPAFELELRLPGSDRVRTVEVVGVLEGFITLPLQGLITNEATAEAMLGAPLPPSVYLIKTREGSDVPLLAQELERAFLTDGMDAVALNELVDQIQAGSNSFNTLFKGFLALGLLVGIAALGVISSRAVVERRQQIGMLRAIGYQSRMVQLSFMIESSFITLLGIALGTGLGLLLSANLIADFAQEVPNLTFQPPWGQLAIIAGGSYLASLVATYLPAHQAARIYPAEALRYE